MVQKLHDKSQICMYRNSNVRSPRLRLAYTQETTLHDYPQMEALQVPPSPNLAAASPQQLMILHRSKVQQHLGKVIGRHYQFLKIHSEGTRKEEKK